MVAPLWVRCMYQSAPQKFGYVTVWDSLLNVTAYCVCHSNLPPRVFNHGVFKELKIPSMKNVIHNWADLKLLAIDIDLVG